MDDQAFFTYIVASRSGVLYIGITNNIRRRNQEHKARSNSGFAAQHRCTRLVWFEIYPTPTPAIVREKQLKGWTRAKKIALIEQRNPHWLDLSDEWDRPLPAPNASSGPPACPRTSLKPGNIPLTPSRKSL
ncbi:MAG: GIY-YIG nuclease family protein [Acidobacteriota bacterium]